MEGSDDTQTPAGGGSHGSYWAAVAGLVLLVGIVGFALLRRPEAPPETVSEPTAVDQTDAVDPTRITAPTPTPMSPETRIVVERYRCICGCDDPLSVCTCSNTPGSRDMKEYLEELVRARKSMRDIDAAMVARYGKGVLLSEPSAAPSSESR
jgi:LPXTG-motif cell wall-anchored protein